MRGVELKSILKYNTGNLSQLWLRNEATSNYWMLYNAYLSKVFWSKTVVMSDKNHKSSVKTIILTYPITAYNKKCANRGISHLLVMLAVINCDVLHQYHHLLRKSRLIKWMCMLYYKLIIFIYVFLWVKIPLVDLHCLTIVCLCQVNFSAF